MNDAVDEGRGARRIGKHRRPLVEREVCREHETPALIASADNLEQQVSVSGVVGEVPELVDAEQRTRGVVAKLSVEGARRFLRAEIEEQLRRADEQCAVTGEQCSVDDVLRDHRLAEALGCDEHDVASVGEEVEPHHRVDGFSVDAGQVRNSDHPDRRNRRMAITETGAWRSPKPGIPITETGDGDRLSAVVRPLPDLR